MKFKTDENLPVEVAEVFSRIRLRYGDPPKSHDGIIVLRLKSQDKTNVLDHIHRLIIVLKQRDPAGELWIVEHDRIRFHESS